MYIRSFLSMFKKNILLISALSISFSILGQDYSGWNAYISYRTVNSSTFDSNGRIWITTDGGIAAIVDDEVSIKLTTINGLSRLDGKTIYYDSETDKLFVGYVDGVIDVINPNDFSVITIKDIFRSTTFTSKSINRILSDGNSLLVGTDFGIVEFDLQNYFVKSTYLKLGDFPSATPINDLFVVNDTLFVGTSMGISISTLNGSYGIEDWDNFDNQNGFVSQEVVSIGYFDNKIYASTNSDNFIYDGNNWNVNSEFGSNVITDYEFQSEKLIALSQNRIYIKTVNGELTSKFIAETSSTLLTNRNNTKTPLFGTLTLGLGRLNLENEIQFLNSDGPYQNFFDDLKFDNTTLIAASTQKNSNSGIIDQGKGFYIFNGLNWENFNQYNSEALDSKGFRQTFRSLVTENYYYFGSWGRGIVNFNKETREIKIFDETNSTIRGWSDAALDYPVMSGIDSDSKGDVWAISRFANPPLYRQKPGDDDWQAFNTNSAVSNSDLYEGLFIDSYDQKWISLKNSNNIGTGLLVLNTGNSEDESDDIGIKLQFGSNNGNLPDNTVNAILEDKNGEVWIGTSRGVAKFIFPELLIEGSTQERAAQWLINEDTSAVSRFLLRDINATALAVNAANEKWVGSANQGVWLLNAEGSRIIKRFNTNNSPLFSNSIKSIAVNDETGEVFFATELGLISYEDVPRKAVSEMEKLKVYPNPFSYEQNQEILIEGLSEKAIIRILAVDGTVVNRFESTGGRVSWNGLDFNNNKLGTGIYYVVALSESGDSKGIGKVVIVR